MALTILLAKVLGSYMLIGGIAMLVRKRFFMSALGAFIEDKGSRLMLAAVDTIFGLFIVNVHNDWSTLPAGIITFIGWAAILKGVTAMFLKDSTLDKFAASFREKQWYFAEGMIVVIVGLYLVAYSFNWF